MVFFSYLFINHITDIFDAELEKKAKPLHKVEVEILVKGKGKGKDKGKGKEVKSIPIVKTFHYLETYHFVGKAEPKDVSKDDVRKDESAG